MLYRQQPQANRSKEDSRVTFWPAIRAFPLGPNSDHETVYCIHFHLTPLLPHCTLSGHIALNISQTHARKYTTPSAILPASCRATQTKLLVQAIASDLWPLLQNPASNGCRPGKWASRSLIWSQKFDRSATVSLLLLLSTTVATVRIWACNPWHLRKSTCPID
jgi:hypothetical protein